MGRPDPLARLEPVARPLLAEVDRALATLGAPGGHPVWSALRRVGVTPADAVATIAGWDPSSLRAAGQSLRQQAQAYAALPSTAGSGWTGPAASAYAAHAAALTTHVAGGAESMAGRLTETAEYADAVANWYERGRSTVAAALAEVLTSAQAIAVRTSTVAASVSPVASVSPAASVSAAADIASHLLDAVAGVIAAGEELPGLWAQRLGVVDFRPAEAAPLAPGIIDIHH
jgi:hypothetical protein